LKKVAILGTVVVLLGCSTATVADDHKTSLTTKYPVVFAPNTIDGIFENIHYQTMLEEQAQQAKELKIKESARKLALLQNSQALSDMVCFFWVYPKWMGLFWTNHLVLQGTRY
jgi:hypothetical protein